MYVKLYTASWALLLLVAGALALTGNFTISTAIVFGFISFGMVFMGMMSVLPAMVSTPEGRTALCESERHGAKQWHFLSDDMRYTLYAWFFPRGVEVRRPRVR